MSISKLNAYCTLVLIFLKSVEKFALYDKTVQSTISSNKEVRKFNFWREEEKDEDERSFVYIHFPLPGKYLINNICFS